MTDTSPRWLILSSAIERLRNHPGNAQTLVEPGFPGIENMKPETIFAGGIEGDLDLPTMMAGRQQANDMFTITFAYQVKDRRTLDDAMARTLELGDSVHDVIVDSTTFDGLDGLASVVPGRREDDARRFPEGIFGFGSYTINCHVRIL